MFVEHLHGTKLASSNWHSKVASWLASMVTVMTVPNAVATAVTINGGVTANGLSVTWSVEPSCEVPLTVILWLPKATEEYTKPSVPVTKIHKDRPYSFDYLHCTNGALSSWHSKVELPELSVIPTVMLRPEIVTFTAKKSAIEKITREFNTTIT